MIAGLPKRVVIPFLLFVCLLVGAASAMGQEVQTPSNTLQPIVDALALNTAATAAQQQQLVDAFTIVLDAGLMTQDQALTIISLVEWSTLAAGEIDGAVALIVDVLGDLSGGSVIDPVGELEARLLALDRQPVFDAIGASSAATADQIQALLDAFTAAFDASTLTPEQALEMLGFVGWSSLETTEDIDLAMGLLTDTLSGLVAGAITDPLGALTDAYNAALTPDGIVNAIGRAGASDETISQVQALVAGGLPPGIAVRVTKEALRDGLTQAEIAELLAELAEEYASGASPGQAANAATGQGSYRHQEQEEEQNSNQGDSGDPEEEKNANGPKENGKGKDNKGGKKP
jgi:hypothetical protein